MKICASSFSSLIFTLTLIYSQLLHPSTCSPSSLDKQILELKIKAITSVELSSMTFNEIPSLFFLYENLVNKRFESIHKKDRKKFEEFRKIHQYHAIKNSYLLSLKLLDVMVSEKFDTEKLEILSKKGNWTDQEVKNYGFLKKVPEASRQIWGQDFDFHEDGLKSFFMAQYFYDNLIHPKDHPSDNEMELRIRFFLHMVIVDSDFKPLTNEFIMEMIEDQNREIFSNQVRMIMKYKFKYLLDKFLPYKLEFVEKISKIFRKDTEILGNLWGIDDNRPYFLRFFITPISAGWVHNLEEIAEKFFNPGFNPQPDTNLTSNSSQPAYKIQAEYIFSGKNQILNILDLIYEKKDKNFTKDILNITKYEVSDEILTKLSQENNFLDFVDSSSYTTAEKREFYLANDEFLIISPKNGNDLLLIWRRMQKYFSANELKNFLTAKEIDFNQTHLFMLPKHNDQSYVETFLNLSQFYLNKDEIKELLIQRFPVSNESFIIRHVSIVRDVKIFEINYNFAKAHLDHEQLKTLLFDNDPVLFIKKISGSRVIFKFCMEKMAEFYTEDEIRDLLMKTDKNNENILFWVIGSSSSNNYRHDVVDYLKEIFKGREDKLRELFRTKDVRGVNVFVAYNQECNQNEVKPFLDFAKELFTKEEVEELYFND